MLLAAGEVDHRVAGLVNQRLYLLRAAKPHLLHKKGQCSTIQQLMWIRIQSDPELFAGSGSEIVCSGSGSSTNERTDKLKFSFKLF